MVVCKTVFTLLITMMVFAATALPAAAEADQCADDKYRGLAEMLRSSADATEFVALTDFAQEYEGTVHRASIEYLNTHPELVQRIRDDLGSQEISWQLEGLSHRLLYAPEQRADVAGLFAAYCREAIDDLLSRTGLADPYHSILPLAEEIPDPSMQQGINALIVQDLAREYEARYQFSGTSAKRIALDLSGRIAVNEVGSYASYLEYSEKARKWVFTRDRQTVWKCSSANPYTVLMAPLEETLHIALREHTEKAIMDAIGTEADVSMSGRVQRVAADWLAVEEAVVGGLVFTLVPDVVISRVPDLEANWIEKDLATKSGFEKYRFLQAGIALVERYGVRESIRRYVKDPLAVRVQLAEVAG
ncbi:MAG TPA: hypothetical protein VLT88_15010 [Desulfosarcina sp.]|nr:hypothetical protein [Desulfosarcina sp.]